MFVYPKDKRYYNGVYNVQRHDVEFKKDGVTLKDIEKTGQRAIDQGISMVVQGSDKLVKKIFEDEVDKQKRQHQIADLFKPLLKQETDANIVKSLKDVKPPPLLEYKREGEGIKPQMKGNGSDNKAIFAEFAKSALSKLKDKNSNKSYRRGKSRAMKGSGLLALH